MKWISVKYRLPEKETEYLVYGDTFGGPTSLWWVNNKWLDKITADFYSCDSPTHWMPLPEPPKEDLI